MKFRCLLLLAILLSFFITMTPAWANDVPAQVVGITDTLDSSVYGVTLVPEEVDRNQLTVRTGPLTFMSASLIYEYIKSVADPTEYRIDEKIILRSVKEDPGITTANASYVIVDGNAITLTTIKGAQPRIVMRC